MRQHQLTTLSIVWVSVVECQTPNRDIHVYAVATVSWWARRHFVSHMYLYCVWYLWWWQVVRIVSTQKLFILYSLALTSRQRIRKLPKWTWIIYWFEKQHRKHNETKNFVRRIWIICDVWFTGCVFVFSFLLERIQTHTQIIPNNWRKVDLDAVYSTASYAERRKAKKRTNCK